MKSADAEQGMDESEIKQTLGSLCRVMEAETAAYQALLPLLKKQRQAAVEAHFEPFVDAVGEKDASLKELRQLESERLQLLANIAKTVHTPPDQLTVSRLIALVPGEEADRLNACRYRLQAVIQRVRETNKTNQDLLRHLHELMKKSVKVLTGKPPEEQTYRENGRVRESRLTGTPLHGQISFEV